MENVKMSILALAMDDPTLIVIVVVGIGLLGVIYFGVRFWLVSTRPPQIPDVPTPNIERRNRQALEHMAEETAEEDEAETRAMENEDSPADLKAVIPEEEPQKEKK